MRSQNRNDLAVGYTRVSTREQAESGLSLEVQESEIRAYCKRSGLDLVQVIIDAGESGNDLERCGMKQLKGLCKKCAVGHVVVLKLDRITRRLIDLLFLQEDVFKKNGIDLHSIRENIDTTTAAGQMYFQMMGVISEFERNTISERTKDAMRQKKIRGEPVGGPPYGFRSGDGKMYEKDEKELKVRRRIKKLRREGKTYQRIAEMLNVRNIPTKKGKKWHGSSVRYIINSSNYW